MLMQISPVTYRQIWKIAYPIILGSIVQNVISVTDTAFLGHVGEIALGAAALGGVFYLTLIMLGLGFSIGTQIIVARRFGERRYGEIGEIIEHSHYFLIFLALVIFIPISSQLDGIFSSLLESEEIREASVDYLGVRIFGLFFAFLNFGFRAFYIGIGKTKVITWTTVFMALINVFFDYALIFGHFGFPEMGIRGAALASVIAESAALVFFIFHTRKWGHPGFFGLFQFKRFRLDSLKRILKVSFPMMGQNLVSFTGWFFFFLFVEKMGERPLAVSNIIRSIYVIMLIPIMGFASATNTLVSQAMGREEQYNVFPIVGKVLRICILSMGIMVMVILIMPSQVLSIYTNNRELIQAALPVVYVISVSSFTIGAGFVVFSGVSGTGSTQISFIIEAITILLYIGVTYFLTRIPGAEIQYVWLVEIFYGLSITFASLFYLKFGKWQHRIV